MSSIKVIGTLALITILSLVCVGCSDSDDPIAPIAPVIDTQPPTLPSGLEVSRTAGQVNLSWDVNVVDTDLAGFIVTRENDGALVTLQGSPALIQSIQDLPPAGLNTYKVYSVDDVANESAFASISYTFEQSSQVSPKQEIQY